MVDDDDDDDDDSIGDHEDHKDGEDGEDGDDGDADDDENDDDNDVALTKIEESQQNLCIIAIEKTRTIIVVGIPVLMNMTNERVIGITTALAAVIDDKNNVILAIRIIVRKQFSRGRRTIRTRRRIARRVMADKNGNNQHKRNNDEQQQMRTATHIIHI